MNLPPNDIFFRPMLLDDIPAVRAIEIATQITPWEETTFRECINAGYDAIILQQQQQMLGFTVSYVRVGECHILNICVRKNSQRQGYASLLLEKILTQAKLRRAKSVCLEVRVSNVAAINLYHKFGFNEVDFRHNYYPTANGYENALVMVLEL